MKPYGSSLALQRSLDRGLPVWLLVDPLLGEPVPVQSPGEGGEPSSIDDARSQAWGRDVQRIPLHDSIDLPAHLQPYLVALHGPSDTWLEQTWQLALAECAATRADGLAGTGRGALRIGGWLQSEHDARALARSLADSMRLRVQVATPARYLRLADRRTLDWLLRVVGGERLAAQFGSVRRWCWLDSCSRLASLESDPARSGADLQLSASEWAMFTLAEEVHPCLARCLGDVAQRNEPDQALETGQWLDRARQAVEAARRAAHRWPAHLPTVHDRIAWAALSLLQPGFEAMPACREWLDRPPSGPDAPGDTFEVHCHTLRAALAVPQAGSST